MMLLATILLAATANVWFLVGDTITWRGAGIVAEAQVRKHRECAALPGTLNGPLWIMQGRTEVFWGRGDIVEARVSIEEGGAAFVERQIHHEVPSHYEATKDHDFPERPARLVCVSFAARAAGRSRNPDRRGQVSAEVHFRAKLFFVREVEERLLPGERPRE